MDLSTKSHIAWGTGAFAPLQLSTAASLSTAFSSGCDLQGLGVPSIVSLALGRLCFTSQEGEAEAFPN